MSHRHNYNISLSSIFEEKKVAFTKIFVHRAFYACTASGGWQGGHPFMVFNLSPPPPFFLPVSSVTYGDDNTPTPMRHFAILPPPPPSKHPGAAPASMYLLYPRRIHLVYKGYVGISVSSVGRAVRCKYCVANYFLSFSPILMKFSTDVCLGV